MDARITQLRRLKKQSDQLKRKYVTGWKTATIILLVLVLLLVPAGVAATACDNELAQKSGGSFWKLKNPVSDTYTAEEPDGQLLLQAQTEGIVLLKNENNALPLQEGTLLDGLGSIADVALVQMGFRYDAQADTTLLSLSGTEGMREYDGEDLQNALNGKAYGNIKTLIVLIADPMPVDGDFLKNNAIDAILWCGGADGEAVAKVLTGVSPAGSLVDTWSYDAPTVAMGIYDGYKYYETRYEDFVMGTGNAGNFNYAEQVAYPFGFGLSYTEFAYSDLNVEYDPATDSFDVSVTVTNGGDTPGKETVQIYAQTPYTDYDKQYGIEKPAVSLVGFAKTGELAPGASERVTVDVDKRELASYDAQGAGTYILDAGDYYLTVATDAHNAVNNILSAKGYTPENTDNRMDGEGSAALTYGWKENALDTKTYAVSKNGTAIQNVLPVAKDTCLSRQDWEGTMSRTGAVAMEQKPYSPADYPNVSMPTMGAKNGLKLSDMVGLAYDDPKWQTLLDQLTFADMCRLVTDGYGLVMPVKTVESPGAKKDKSGLPMNEVLLSATFDAGLMKAVGNYMGNVALSGGTPIVQLSMGDYEDSFMAGSLRSALVQGMGEKGIAAVTEVSSAVNLLNEQFAREIYWRQYQAVLENNPTAGVSGVIPATVVQEWGSHGVWIAGEKPAAEGILAGITSYNITTRDALKQYENDPVIVSALRQACHNNLYTLANSAAMNGIGADTVVQVRQLPLVTGLWIALAVCAVLMIVFMFLWIRGQKKWQKTVAFLDYRTMKNTLKAEKEK